MKSKIMSILLIVIVVLNFSSCNDKTSTDKYIRYPISSDPICLDPQIATSQSALLTLSSCMEGLVRIDENEKIVPAVATSWDTDSNECEYTFHLRNDSNWLVTKKIKQTLGGTFNTNITAHDFVFALRRAVSPETNAPNSHTLFAIKNAPAINNGELSPTQLGVYAVDNYTLKIKLSSPDPNLLYTLASAISLPCNEDFFNLTAGRYGLSSEMFLSNGPFYLSKWTKGSSLSLKRNSEYTGENVTIPVSLSLFVNEDEDALIRNLLEGTYDAIPISEDKLSNVEKEGINIHSYTNITWVLGFNCGITELNNDNIRKALSYSIEISSLKNKGFDIDATGLIPPSMQINGQNYRKLANNPKTISTDVELAKSFYNLGLSELEVENINSLKLICTNDLQTKQFVGNLIQHWQKNLGVYFDLEAVSKQEFNARIRSGDYELAYYPLEADSIYLLDYLQKFSGENGKNPQNYNSEDFNTLLNSFTSITTDESRLNKIILAEDYLLQNAVVYPIRFEKTYYATGVGVSGIDFHIYNGNVYFTKAERLD